MLEAGHAFNALPQRAQATVNCRVLPGEPVEEVQKTLARVVDDNQISVTPTLIDVSSKRRPHAGDCAGCGADDSGFLARHPVIPTMSAGATDGLFLRNAGIPNYGTSGLAGDIDDVRAHGKDERVLVKSFNDGQEYLYRLVKALSSNK